MTAAKSTPLPPTIAIAGVGGPGCTMVLKHQRDTTRLASPLQYLAIDTDPTCIPGIHAMPTLLLRADALDVEALETWLAPCQTLYLLAGLGGRASLVAAPALVRIARDMGLHTVALVTMPFDWESDRRIGCAEQALRSVYVQAHEMVVVDSDRCVQHLGDDCAMQDMFDCLDPAVLRELDAQLVPRITRVCIKSIKSLPPSWLKRQIPDDEPMHIPGYFDSLHYDREAMRANMQPGDELWEYSTPTQTLAQRMCMRAGLVVLRQGKVVDMCLTSMG